MSKPIIAAIEDAGKKTGCSEDIINSECETAIFNVHLGKATPKDAVETAIKNMKRRSSTMRKRI